MPTTSGGLSRAHLAGKSQDNCEIQSCNALFEHLGTCMERWHQKGIPQHSKPYLESWLGGCRRRNISSGRWSPWGRRTQRSTHGTGQGHHSQQGHKSQICPTVLSCMSAPPPAAEKAKLHQTPLSELSNLLVCHHNRKV